VAPRIGGLQPARSGGGGGDLPAGFGVLPYREFVEAGLAEPCYHGPSGYRTYIEGTYEVWGANVRIEPKELIDLGDRMVVLADMPMRAQASGVPLGETYACVVTMKDGRVIRQSDFLDHADALKAVGLEE
jgi:hypothetical protein